ncbi:MAG: hypothetical protein RJB66_2057 [Pseudomonadota bacterium]|jgi:hypothetical protein
MKKLFIVTLFLNLMISFVPILSSVSHAQVNPWPWAKPLPFPWDSIEGTWSESNTLYALSFKVVSNSWGSRHIRIKQIDPYNNRVIAQGVGYENSEGIVVAGMTGGQKQQFLLTIRLLQRVHCWDKRNVTGVTMETYDHKLISHFEIHKIKEIPLTTLNHQDYTRSQPETVNFEPTCWWDEEAKRNTL